MKRRVVQYKIVESGCLVKIPYGVLDEDGLGTGCLIGKTTRMVALTQMRSN